MDPLLQRRVELLCSLKQAKRNTFLRPNRPLQRNGSSFFLEDTDEQVASCTPKQTPVKRSIEQKEQPGNDQPKV
jgi:hypothetical protein